MFGGSKSKLPTIVSFIDGKKIHCEVTPGATPGLLSAISGENEFLELWCEGKRKYYLRQHILCVEADDQAQAELDARTNHSAT